MSNTLEPDDTCPHCGNAPYHCRCETSNEVAYILAVHRDDNARADAAGDLALIVVGLIIALIYHCL